MDDAGAPWCIEPRHELPLRILLAADEQARNAARRWLADIDLDRLPGDTAALLPAVYLRLSALGVEHGEMIRLRGVYRFHWYRNRLCVRALQPLFEALEAHGIAAAPIGWLALARRGAAEWGAREIATADVLVAQDSAAAAVAVIEAAGWKRADADAAPLAPARLRTRASALFHSHDGFALTVHWRLYDWGLNPRHGIDLDRCSRTGEGAGSSSCDVDTAQQLLWLSVLDPTRQPAAPAWVADAAELLRHGAVDWDRLVECAEAATVAGNARRGLRTLARLGQPVPERVIAALGRSRADPDLLIARLHRPGARLGPLVYRYARLARRGRGAPGGGIKYVRQLWAMRRRREKSAG